MKEVKIKGRMKNKKAKKLDSRKNGEGKREE